MTKRAAFISAIASTQSCAATAAKASPEGQRKPPARPNLNDFRFARRFIRRDLIEDRAGFVSGIHVPFAPRRGRRRPSGSPVDLNPAFEVGLGNGTIPSS